MAYILVWVQKLMECNLLAAPLDIGRRQVGRSGSSRLREVSVCEV